MKKFIEFIKRLFNREEKKSEAPSARNIYVNSPGVDEKANSTLKDK